MTQTITTEAPPEVVEPAKAGSRSIRRVGIVVALVLVAATFGLAYRAVVGPDVADGSSVYAEHTRLRQLAPVADISSEQAEFARMVALRAVADASWEQAEYERMHSHGSAEATGRRPITLADDSSWLRVEHDRMLRLDEG